QAVLALTDHVSLSNVEAVLEALRRERDATCAWSEIEVFVGVEITQVPVGAIAEVARRARRAGAEIVLVHGETLSEPVEPGTNRAALECPQVDLLAHPGLLSGEEAELALRKGIFLELSARGGHCPANGHLVRLARAAGALSLLLLNTDAHRPDDLIGAERAVRLARGAGLSEEEAQRVVGENAERLLVRLQGRR
ncbi:MAG TPA: histidinol phosphate phosphatase domain-containing protein, partial [Candidatus Fraserbacteria bacterium]|nr:histidinol phosphate phosphatase domain-containing protein [Candidatus Fraserbacteria bacterium]